MTRKRGNNEGGLYRRADGMWCASLTIGYDPRGHRKRRVVYGKTKTEVQKKLLELQSASAAGTLIDPKRMKVAEYLKHWLEDMARLVVRRGTYDLYDRLVRLHVVPHIGGVQITALQPSQIQALYSTLEKQGASPRLREMVHNLLHKALSQAVDWGYLSRNPGDVVRKAKVPKKQMRYLNQEQTERFLQQARTDRYYALYLLALVTGLRQGELLGLRWGDINFSDRALAVQRTAYRLKNEVCVDEPKTSKGRRRIDLPDVAIVALKEHREKMFAEGHIDNWVFCNREGELAYSSNLLRRSFKPLLARAELPAIRFHDLRHTAATLLLAQGTHPKVVQERLGHAQISLTLDTYSHVLPSLQKEAAAKLDVLFRDFG